jgi:hypothetical protein
MVPGPRLHRGYTTGRLEVDQVCRIRIALL